MNSPLTVFVVDDEQIVREFFSRNFPWQSLEMRWIGDAGDGMTALERCRELHPDLLLVDITMPGINGLELLARVNQEMPYVNSVLLTCHQEFSYVQTALRLGALDYLVKAATTPDEMVGKLAQVRNRMIAKRNKVRLSTLQRELLTKLLHKSTQLTNPKTRQNFEAEMVRLHFPLANAACALLWVSLHPRMDELDPYLEYADVHDDPRMRYLLDSFIAAAPQTIWAEPRVSHPKANQYAIVTNIVENDPISQMRALCNLLQEMAGDEYTVIAGASEVAPDLFQLRRALMQARHAISARFYDEGEHFFLARPAWLSLAPEFQQGLEELARSSEPTGANFYERLDSLVASAITICRDQGVDPEITKLIVLHLIQKKLEDFGCRIPQWEQAIWPMQLDQIETVSQLRRWAVQMVSPMLSHSKAAVVRPEIQLVLAHLDEHMAAPWDVTTMAGLANMHPNYFSVVFKSEMGQSPSEYLARLRMNRAAQYLQEGVWSMQQIANMVGISNYRTFYNTFCRIMGSSPKEFSDRISRLLA